MERNIQSASNVVTALWKQDWIGRLVVFVNFVALVAVPVVIALKVYSDTEWQVFAEENGCQKMNVETADFQFDAAMKVPDNHPLELHSSMSTPHKTGWQCNNGMTYWR